jgi:hypothetical protein
VKTIEHEGLYFEYWLLLFCMLWDTLSN